MQTSRRTFLQAAASSAVGSALAASAMGQIGSDLPNQGMDAWGAVEPSGKKLKILMLGGTGFLGPRLVRYAMLRGHEVTLFNRGRRPNPFPELEFIQGNRDPEIDPGLQPLQDEIDKGRRWDLVLDTSAYFKRTAQASADVLKDACDQYLFVSTLCAYENWGALRNADESAPLAMDGPEDSENVNVDYCYLQSLCERIFAERIPGKHTIIRPGLIVGPGDYSDRFTYWPVRVRRGGEVLVAGEHTDPIQWIDVRDLARFIVHCGEQKHFGSFNCCGPSGVGTIGELVYACKAITGSNASLTWIDDAEFLETNQIRPWAEMPLWADPENEELGGVNSYNNAKALAAGMELRPLGDTIRDTLAYWDALPDERRAQLRAGIAAEREAEVLGLWKNRQG